MAAKGTRLGLVINLHIRTPYSVLRTPYRIKIYSACNRVGWRRSFEQVLLLVAINVLVALPVTLGPHLRHLTTRQSSSVASLSP